LVQACPPLQRVPHAPQFVGSDVVLTQLLPQTASPVLQDEEHVLCEQTWPAAHTWPQLPQLLPSELKLTHPELHAERGATHEHCPPEQVWSPLHIEPQLPQLKRSVPRFTHWLPQAEVPNWHDPLPLPPPPFESPEPPPAAQL
jgi:hypothetical protein